MTTRIVTDANGRKHITNEPQLHPPQRTWVGLTDAEKESLWERGGNTFLIEKVEALLKEKNS